MFLYPWFELTAVVMVLLNFFSFIVYSLCVFVPFALTKCLFMLIYLLASLEPCQCVIWTSCSQRFGFGGCCSALYSPTIKFPIALYFIVVTLWLLSLGQLCRDTGGWLPCAFLDL